MDNDGDDDHLHIVANLNYGWGAAANASIDALFGNRGGFTYSYTVRGVPVNSTAKLVAYRNADTSVDVYLMFADVYATASYTVLETTEETVYTNPADLLGAAPLGTLVFDSSSPNYPPTTFSGFNGNVGIGTTSTNAHKLMVRDTGTNGIVWSMAVNNPVNVQGASLPAVGIKLSLSTEESGGNESDKWDGLLAYTEPGAEFGNSMGLAIYTNQAAGWGQAPTEKMRITAGGNVGIGTTNPQYLLSVNGTIQAKEVLVNTGWADYVFQPDYRVRPLAEVAAFIKANHHLPDIPSETEIKDKGVSLGDMQTKLLAKIEELTLQMIQLDEKNRTLEKRVAQIQAARVARSGRNGGK